MGVFTRFKDIINANINSLLDKAEDPEKMLRLMISDMEDTLIELKSSCASRMAEEIRLSKKIEANRECIDRWQNRARLAIEKGKEDLAREALIEKKNVMETLKNEMDSFNELKEDVEEAKKDIKSLEDKIESAKLKLKTLEEREKRAQAEARRAQDDSMKDHFEKMEERINRMKSWNDLNEKENAEDKFRKMERDEEIEKELTKMKEEAKEA